MNFATIITEYCIRGDAVENRLGLYSLEDHQVQDMHKAISNVKVNLFPEHSSFGAPSGKANFPGEIITRHAVMTSQLVIDVTGHSLFLAVLDKYVDFRCVPCFSQHVAVHQSRSPCSRYLYLYCAIKKR